MILGNAEEMNETTWICDQPDASPINGRAITMHCYEGDDYLEAVGRLTDTRHWASVLGPEGIIHDMELRLRITRDEFTITHVKATMFAHPHAECSDIEQAFQQLVGVSVMRGYTRTVQELLGRERGCSHLEFMARALGPVVIQAATSLIAKARMAAGPDEEHKPGPWMRNTCHIWADGGPAPTKLEMGWKPGTIYPVPRVEEVRAMLDAGEIDRSGS